MHAETPAAEPLYRDLIPADTPDARQQFAFEVDLDACSGCKACVAACHSLNGLEEHEVWRSVGQLVGGDSESPVIQHVTTACHHCIEPACLHGCPVNAYVKDETTGIVRHLDDQCIGCQYCVLKCPYDVPVYSSSKGIVRKCDMCHDRLLAGEAPACVQSCPNHAIQIAAIDREEAVENSEAGFFLPGAPDRRITVPTTRYKTRRSHTANLLPADHYFIWPAHGHLPLVCMLVLTQMSVGAFCLEHLLQNFTAPTATPPIVNSTSLFQPWFGLVAWLSGVIGLLISVLHLGRPWLAYRAILGLRRSWLSREIVVFGLFAVFSSFYLATILGDSFNIPTLTGWQAAAGSLTSMTGVLAVFCSVMIYVDTRRPCWTFPLTASKFFLTCALLGLSVSLLVLTTQEAFSSRQAEIDTSWQFAGLFPWCGVIVAIMLKLSVELSLLSGLRSRHHTMLRRSAMLVVGPLWQQFVQRLCCAAVGGVLIPMLVIVQLQSVQAFTVTTVVASGLSLAMLLVGELLERYLFFAASVAPKMPGIPDA